jgi:hypothetical protein
MPAAPPNSALDCVVTCCAHAVYAYVVGTAIVPRGEAGLLPVTSVIAGTNYVKILCVGTSDVSLSHLVTLCLCKLL